MSKYLNKLHVFICFFTIIFFTQCKKYDSKKLKGTYINHNYSYKPIIPDIPYTNDTLIIKDNFTFSSNYFGNGTYKINNSFLENSIIFTYNYEFGQATFETNIETKKNNEIVIVLYKEKNHYYQKIN